jgi:sugar phosphate isomerase/epimerase
MRTIGFSSGALAKGDFRLGIELQRAEPRISAVELSALREHELFPLLEAVETLDLSGFAYVSLHAPSRIANFSEAEMAQALFDLPEQWPIVVHPQLITDPTLWRRFGRRLCVENMDIGKRIGRTAGELKVVFDVLPDAGFCLDLGHAWQMNPSMTIAWHLLDDFGDRLRQIHVSEVDSYGKHLPMGWLSREAFRRVVRFIPAECPLILETTIPPERMGQQLDYALSIFG